MLFPFLGDMEITFSKNCFDSILGSATLVENLWQLECNVVFNEHHSLKVSTKRMLNTETSYILWHNRLGDISKDGISKLSKVNLIHNLTFLLQLTV